VLTAARSCPTRQGHRWPAWGRLLRTSDAVARGGGSRNALALLQHLSEHLRRCRAFRRRGCLLSKSESRAGLRCCRVNMATWLTSHSPCSSRWKHSETFSPNQLYERLQQPMANRQTIETQIAGSFTRFRPWGIRHATQATGFRGRGRLTIRRLTGSPGATGKLVLGGSRWKTSRWPSTQLQGQPT
jgi:hypothetical protein